MIIPVLAFLEACPGLGLFVSGVILLTVSTILYTEQIASLSEILPLALPVHASPITSVSISVVGSARHSTTLRLRKNESIKYRKVKRSS